MGNDLVIFGSSFNGRTPRYERGNRGSTPLLPVGTGMTFAVSSLADIIWQVMALLIWSLTIGL